MYDDCLGKKVEELTNCKELLQKSPVAAGNYHLILATPKTIRMYYWGFYRYALGIML